MEATAKAHGKILLYGAYAILEPGNLGCVLTIDKGTTTTVEQTSSGKIVIDLKHFEVSIQGVVQGKKIDFGKHPDVFTYIKNAVQYTFAYLHEKGIKIKDIRIISMNDPQLYLDKKLKTGLGSSATSTVSTVAAILHIHDIDDPDIIYKISRFSHYASQGRKGSGYDVAACVFGSQHFLAEEPPQQNFFDYVNQEVSLQREEFVLPHFLKPVVIFTGRSSSTVKFVSKVLSYKKKHPQEYAMFMEEYNRTNVALKKSLDAQEVKRTRAFLEKSWQMRRELGEKAGIPIETDKDANFIEVLKRNGAFTAGLTGAGGGDTIIAFAQTDEDRDTLLEFLERKRIQVLDVHMSNEPYKIL